MIASSKNDFGCCRHTFTRVALKICLQRKWQPRRSGGRSRPPWSDRESAAPEGVQIRLVVAQQFDVLQTRAAGQQVVGDVQDVVAVVVRQMDLQQAKTRVDRLDRVRAFAPTGGSPRSRRGQSPACGRQVRNGCSRPSSWAARNPGCPFCPIAGRSAAWLAANVSLYWVSLEILLVSWNGFLRRAHYIRENKGGFEFFHAISVKGSLV